MDTIKEFLEFLEEINKGIIKRNEDEPTRKYRKSLLKLILFLKNTDLRQGFNIKEFRILFKYCDLNLKWLILNGYIPLYEPNR